jgi:predicted helicase
MPHLLAGDNLGLIFMRQVAMGDEYSHFGVSRAPVDARAFYSNKGIMSFAPLYLYPGMGKADSSLFNRWPAGKGGRTPNLDPGFVAKLGDATSLGFANDGRGDLEETFGPEDVFAYLYAVFHSRVYRRRYEPQLKLDFPRLPLPASRALLRELVKPGDELLALHLLESRRLGRLTSKYLGGPVAKVEKASWSENTVWLDKAQTIGFKGVPEEVWNFHVGGYQVCAKWLKDRKGRELSKEDIAHYQKIVVALSETIRSMGEIDEVIDAHGGWPDAFDGGS